MLHHPMALDLSCNAETELAETEALYPTGISLITVVTKFCIVSMLRFMTLHCYSRFSFVMIGFEFWLVRTKKGDGWSTHPGFVRADNDACRQ